jgi:hypothetical protein
LAVVVAVTTNKTVALAVLEAVLAVSNLALLAALARRVKVLLEVMHPQSLLTMVAVVAAVLVLLEQTALRLLGLAVAVV